MQKSNKFKKIIISTGSTITDCINFLKKNKNHKYNWFSIPLWGMSTKKKQFNLLKKYNEIVTFENHLQDGGFGSWVGEILNQRKKNIKINVHNKFINSKVVGQVGSETYLNSLYGPK